MALSAQSWAALGAGVTIAGGFALGGYLRKRALEETLERLKTKIPGLRTFSQFDTALAPRRGAIKSASNIGKALMIGKPLSAAARLEDALQAWAVLADVMIEELGPSTVASTYQWAMHWPRSAFAEGTYGRVHGPKIPGLLYNNTDLMTTAPTATSSFRVGPNALPFSPHARALWDRDPETPIADVGRLIDQGLQLAALEQDRGNVVQLGDAQLSLGELAEQYATKEAIGYLVNAVPGGGAVLAVGEALGGPGWNYGITEVKTGDFAGWDQVRAVALERAADLINWAKTHPHPPR